MRFGPLSAIVPSWTLFGLTIYGPCPMNEIYQIEKLSKLWDERNNTTKHLRAVEILEETKQRDDEKNADSFWNQGTRQYSAA